MRRVGRDENFRNTSHESAQPASQWERNRQWTEVLRTSRISHRSFLDRSYTRVRTRTAPYAYLSPYRESTYIDLYRYVLGSSALRAFFFFFFVFVRSSCNVN